MGRNQKHVKRLTVYIPDDLADKFNKWKVDRYGERHGSLSMAAEEVFRKFFEDLDKIK